MLTGITRRSFLATTAAAAALRAWPAWASPVDESLRFRARPFDLRKVRLLPGECLESAEVNRRYMTGLAPDRLLHTFRLTAGLPSSAEPLGGWEAPENELRGHFTGHYLSACARANASLGDEMLKSRGEQIVSELAKCQKAIGNGYLSAFPEEFFDRLRADRPVWAPWYTVHKIMAGLLDMHTHCGSAQALEVLKGMVAWTRRWVDPLGDAQMERVLEREYGGMNEVVYNLAAVTGERSYRQLARRFDHERIFAPLAEGRDELKGLHVNTQIPKIIGAARRYELTGESRYRDIAQYFLRQVASKRSYCTGGTSNGERWLFDAGKLANQLSGHTQECCCSYNMLRLTRHVFGWTADAEYADYFERVMFNGILGTQHPSDGSLLYYVPLASGYWKLFGTPLNDFWCCTGSGIESFAKLGDSIYFQDDEGLFVNLFIASELDWREKGVRLTQQTRFPAEDTTTLILRCEQPVRMALRVRVPYWSTRGSVRLNGKSLESFAAPGGYFVMDRTWKDKDELEITLPMNLHVHAMPDDESLQAIMYGPLVLAGRLGTEGLNPSTLRAEPTKPRTVPNYPLKPVAAPAFRTPSADPSTWIKSVSGRPLEFQTVGQAQNVTLVPLYRLYDERYAVYWKVAPDGAA